MSEVTAILRKFHGAAGEFVRLTAGEQPKLPELEKLGFVIESHPHLGHRLVKTPDRLLGEDLQARVQTRVIGSTILVFEETSSTNDVVLRMAGSGTQEGLAVFAESQTRGRGRRGRVWMSPKRKGLWFSVLLRPRIAPVALTRVTVAASVAVARALHQFAGVNARIKWPNDVTVGGRKLAGILTEMHGEADEIKFAILGIGIDMNCRQEELPEGIPATSLLIETGEAQDRAALAAVVLTALDDAYRLALENFDAVIEEWAQLCTTLGKQIAVTMGPRRIEGHAQALDGDGALLLRQDNGRIERIVGGDIVVEK